MTPIQILTQLLNGHHLEPAELKQAEKILHGLNAELKSRTSPESLWEKRVQELEAEGATTSDAQAVADAEMEKTCAWGWATQ